MWESKDEREPRREYFNRCLTQISSITERALPLDDRQISKSLKKLVWAKCVDEMCAICEDEITEKEFEAGHIVARALGGQVNIENLIPICFECNRGMGTRNAYEYKKDMYPEFELVSVSQEEN
jgi:5-methylcytosine-specific restriction endonuclease McrA